jgi:DNA-binding XRE family transcriptional regulator
MTAEVQVLWTFGDRLRKAREWCGIGTQEMAERVQVSRNSVTSWERNRHRPRPRDVAAWASVTGFRREWLESGGGEPFAAVSGRMRSRMRLAA